MSLRIIMAGVLAAVAMFMWQWVAHDLLPLGLTGVSTIQNEQAVQDALKTNIDHNGLYMFPMAMAKGDTTAQGPEGMLIYHRDIAQMSPMMLGGEFVLEIIEMLILAFLITQTNLIGLGPRLGFATLAGIMVAITTNGSYHIWYGFPADYTAAAIIMTVVGYMLGGVVIALLLPKKSMA
jgi:hypothetical protein